MSEQTFDTALAAFVAHATSVVDAGHARFENLHAIEEAKVAIDDPDAPKYVRLVRVEQGRPGQEPHPRVTVYGFVRRADGAILYAAGWKRPYIAKAGPDAKPGTIRGSIYEPGSWACCGPYGILGVR